LIVMSFPYLLCLGACVFAAIVGLITVSSLVGLFLFYGPLRLLWNARPSIRKYLGGSITRLGLVSFGVCMLAGFAWAFCFVR